MKYKATTATASVKRSCDQEGEGEGKGRGHLLLPLLSLEFGTRQKKKIQNLLCVSVNKNAQQQRDG